MAGERHEMRAHQMLEAFIDEYLAAPGIREDGKTPLFRSAIGKTGVLTEQADELHRRRRCTAETGFKIRLGCHVFRATGILDPGGTLENAQAMAAHEARVPPSSTTAPATRLR